MPVAITSVRGIGGSPPATIRVEGTKQNCELGVVTSTCSSVTGYATDAIWTVDLPNDTGGCGCGDDPGVTVVCQGGLPDDKTKFLGEILCDGTCCPRVNVQFMISGCAPTTARASFTVPSLLWPMGCDPTPVERYVWTLQGPLSVTPTKKYVIATTTSMVDTNRPWIDDDTGQLATVQFLVGGTGTFSISVTVEVRGFESPPCGLTASSSFQVPACTTFVVTPPCPTVQIMQTGTGCAEPDPANPVPGISQFVAIVMDPAGVATSIDWNFGDSGSGAANLLTQPPPFGQVSHSYVQPGPYMVTARVNSSMACMPQGSNTASLPITVPVCPCPPDQVRNPNTNKCEPVTPPSCPPGQQRDSSGNCVPIGLSRATCCCGSR